MSLIRHLVLIATILTAASWSAAGEPELKPDTPPVPVRTPPPQFPPQLKRDGVSGIVTVSIVVDDKGVVTAAEINKSSNPGFDAPSLEAVKKWRFTPAQKNNQPVTARVVVPLHFRDES